MKANFIIILALFFSISSFGQLDSTLYSFFVAGHTYGKPGVNNVGFHPPFKQKFTYLQNRPEIEFGILTGDIVSPFPVPQDWDEIDTDLDSLGIPVYFAVGNHDMENRDLFESRYGATYYNFVFQNDLFVILDPNIDGWNISGDQLHFLQNTLANHASTSNNIYVFFHQIIWRETDNLFSYIQYNSSAGRDNSINFWSEVAPIFRCLQNDVFMFAGDLGASWSSNVTYDIYDNITFISSGMGDEDGENFIVVNVNSDRTLDYDLICLSDTDNHCLGMLTDYLIINEVPFSMISSVFPNPTIDFATISLNKQSSPTLQLFNLQGVLMHEEKFNDQSELTINIEGFSPGIYLGRVFNTISQSNFKVIVQ